MKKTNVLAFFFTFLILNPCFSTEIFNSKLTQDERETLESGKVLIKKINYTQNMCLNPEVNENTKKLTETFKKLSPKYLAEIIQIRPYASNENLPEVLTQMLHDVSSYAGIPYYSVRAEEWYDLYDSAEIISETTNADETQMQVELVMSPFGTISEDIYIKNADENLLYIAENTNKLRYRDQFDCVWPNKMKISICLFRDGDNWILYGIGGVNAPRIPFFTERIDTSFINRIKSFCNYMFEQLDNKTNGEQ